MAVLGALVLTACATVPRVDLRINGIEMPTEAQAEYFTLYDASGKHSMVVYWYYVQEIPQRISARGNSEVVLENQPLGLNLPKKFPANTKMVGIHLFVYNPDFLKFRVVKKVKGPNIEIRKQIYQGIRNYLTVVLKGPLMKDQSLELSARIELMQDSGVVADSDDLGNLVYSIGSSG